MRHFEETVVLDGIDELGLTVDDQKIIKFLTIQPGKPVRLFTLEAATGIHRRTIQEVIEPFLIREGLIERTPQGRVITDKGMQSRRRQPSEVGNRLSRGIIMKNQEPLKAGRNRHGNGKNGAISRGRGSTS